MHKLYVDATQPLSVSPQPEWSWPVDPHRYDRSARLRKDEIRELAYLAARQRPYGHFPEHTKKALLRLTDPLDDVMNAIKPPSQSRSGALTVMLIEMHRRRRTFWAWTFDEWMEIFHPTAKAFHDRYRHTNSHARQMLVAGMYLLKVFDNFRALGIIDRTALACRIFGRQRVAISIKRIIDLIRSWGYSRYSAKDAQWAVCTLLLAAKSPHLEDITLDLLEAERKLTRVRYRQAAIGVLSRALAGLSAIAHPLSRPPARSIFGDARNGVPAEWVSWVERWRDTCTLQPKSRKTQFIYLLKVGRWIASAHPDCVSPDRWTREIAAEWVGTVCRMAVGEWTQVNAKYQKRRSKPLSAKSKAHLLSSLCTFFRDIQEWEWIPRSFDPRRCFRAPRSLRALIAPNARVIAEDIWAKLLWAGINLTQDDLTTSFFCARHFYPLPMVRALSIVWLFGGLRVDEIRRLRVGCVRLHPSSSDSAGTVCDLTIPANKTSAAFVKPVDHVVGEAVQQWEAERPQQPSTVDEKTGEVVDFLFMFRGNGIAGEYINKSLVPILCAKAGVPRKDARGNITSHRARSTIASQLFNAKEPMSLFELGKWLGHKWVNSTQHYLAISPEKLATSFQKAGYFARNIRAIEVLIDREVVMNGAASNEPWKFYDLGHGYCAYDFFDQCPHRMACAKCSFYVAKGSSHAQLLEGKANLLRMRQEIPLSDAEVAAVDDGLAAFDNLLSQLADVPTPAGPTPRELRASELVQIEPGHDLL